MIAAMIVSLLPRKTRVRSGILLLLGVLLVSLGDARSEPPPPQDNIGHDRHLHRHNERHPTVLDIERFTTSRDGASLRLPVENDAFTFAVFGDRTGGPAGGVSVLADAVRDVNLLEPDFVMTVGDLIEGYNGASKWLHQMHEFKAIMDELICPWFPVAGNHDIYWRGKGEKPEGEHEAAYERHFGPLWYAFEHKACWFIVLYSDEGDPETGLKDFHKAECQRISDEQYRWLEQTLRKSAGAPHVFLFLHHPRWLGGNYGDDWDRVHALLKAAGNVTAVFAGHVHYMRYDTRDDIHYVTLATTGGHQSGRVPSTSWLHHYDLVTVRDSQIALAAVPVGEIRDVREITGEVADETSRLSRLQPTLSGAIEVASDGAASGTLRLELTNPVTRPIDATLTFSSRDSRWRFAIDHRHEVLMPGASTMVECEVRRAGASLDDDFEPPTAALAIDYLARTHRYPVPSSEIELPLQVTLDDPVSPVADGVLALDGQGDSLRIDSAALELPADGPLTVECWMLAQSFGQRVGLVSKTEQSEFGIHVSGGRPSFLVFLGDSYVTATTPEAVLTPGRWHHLAGVRDGKQARLYIDGKLVATSEGDGMRRRNSLPLFIGADVDGKGKATSHFTGRIDEVRISRAARYRGDRFEPQRRHESDAATALLLHMDRQHGPWTADSSGSQAHARRRGDARIERSGAGVPAVK